MNNAKKGIESQKESSEKNTIENKDSTIKESNKKEIVQVDSTSTNSKYSGTNNDQRSQEKNVEFAKSWVEKSFGKSNIQDQPTSLEINPKIQQVRERGKITDLVPSRIEPIKNTDLVSWESSIKDKGTIEEDMISGAEHSRESSEERVVESNLILLFG
ncbi:hypothetical protein K7X08_016070 [Anisodus acutangulus]|uniref:Uncharacterized protein n=1 Tax=Anisodus acutangulus TaxID=402998 RepID=A0A9Q1QXN8_9SOLA|nr:hypothetical protein K7X08_016070 [Anisodus acutangulus]